MFSLETISPEPSSRRKGIKSDKERGWALERPRGWGVWSGAPEEGLSDTSAAPQRAGVLEGGGWGTRCPARGATGGGRGAPASHLRGGARERAGPGRRPPAGAGRAVGVPRPPAAWRGRRRGRGAAAVRSAPRGERAAPPPAACARCCVPGPAPPPLLPSPPSPPPAAPSERERHTAPGRHRQARRDAEQVAGGCGRCSGERRGELRARRRRPGRAGHASRAAPRRRRLPAPLASRAPVQRPRRAQRPAAPARGRSGRGQRGARAGPRRRRRRHESDRVLREDPGGRAVRRRPHESFQPHPASGDPLPEGHRQGEGPGAHGARGVGAGEGGRRRGRRKRRRGKAPGSIWRFLERGGGRRRGGGERESAAAGPGLAGAPRPGLRAAKFSARAGPVGRARAQPG